MSYAGARFQMTQLSDGHAPGFIHSLLVLGRPDLSWANNSIMVAEVIANYEVNRFKTMCTHPRS